MRNRSVSLRYSLVYIADVYIGIDWLGTRERDLALIVFVCLFSLFFLPSELHRSALYSIYNFETA